MRTINDIDLRLLRVFKTVAEAGGFSQAAVVLNVGTSTISTHMADLERRLGYRLCERGRSGFLLTDAGQQTLTQIIRLFREIEDCAANLNAIRGELSGTLNIGLIDYMTSVPEFDIARVLREFTAQASSVVLNLQVLPEPELIRSILNGEMHVGIGPCGPARPGLKFEPFLSETAQLYCAPTHTLFRRDLSTITREEAYSHRFAGRRFTEDTDVGSQNIESEDARATNLEVIAFLILSGEYIGFLPTHFAKQWVNKEQMRAIRPDQLSFNQDLMLVTRSSGRAPPALEAFMSLLRTLKTPDERKQTRDA